MTSDFDCLLQLRDNGGDYTLLTHTLKNEHTYLRGNEEGEGASQRAIVHAEMCLARCRSQEERV